MISAGTKVSSTEPRPAMRPAKTPIPTITSAKKFAALVTTKNATERRAMCAVGIPASRSAQTPRASPPAPPAGSSEFAASSDMAMS